MTVRPAKTQISLGIRPVWSVSSLCAQWVAKGPRFLHADSEDSDQTGAVAQADLSLCWAHIPFCWFCHEAAHLYVLICFWVRIDLMQIIFDSFVRLEDGGLDLHWPMMGKINFFFLNFFFDTLVVEAFKIRWISEVIVGISDLVDGWVVVVVNCIVLVDGLVRDVDWVALVDGCVIVVDWVLLVDGWVVCFSETDCPNEH